MEENIYFDSNGVKIEGLLSLLHKDKAVVVTHPHPLYGGNMYNPVVKAITDAYQKKEYSTLRFNFRGTGKSEGKFENGSGEASDLIAAVHFMRSKGVKALCVSGYSFGAWVNAMAVHSCGEIREMTMVSPPVAFVDFDPITPSPVIKLIITGSLDDIAPANKIKAWLGTLKTNFTFETIYGADHFYNGYTSTLEEIIAKHI
jgi:uncharacterized protein